MSAPVVVWSKPSCVQCNAVYRAFDKAKMVKGVDYEVRNLPDFPEKLEEFKAAGLMQAPVVESDVAETFAGNNPYLVKEIVAVHGKAE
jgi:glutaredoxin-like protein NrdH